SYAEAEARKQQASQRLSLLEQRVQAEEEVTSALIDLSPKKGRETFESTRSPLAGTRPLTASILSDHGSSGNGAVTVTTTTNISRTPQSGRPAPLTHIPTSPLSSSLRNTSRGAHLGLTASPLNVSRVAPKLNRTEIRDLIKSLDQSLSQTSPVGGTDSPMRQSML
ncbi:hypothetical protein KIPB_013051, partial [Kipferlia bialata]